MVGGAAVVGARVVGGRVGSWVVGVGVLDVDCVDWPGTQILKSLVIALPQGSITRHLAVYSFAGRSCPNVRYTGYSFDQLFWEHLGYIQPSPQQLEKCKSNHEGPARGTTCAVKLVWSHFGDATHSQNPCNIQVHVMCKPAPKVLEDP